jgi:alkanesulfonate monooxygenase SsuD/methylene tetrahydromethanopterin reductase-like flavin-dependent oxidoreductase (luciferase family)
MRSTTSCSGRCRRRAARCRSGSGRGRTRRSDGYHSSATSPEAYARRLPVIRAAAQEAGRPMPALSARVRVEFGAAPAGPTYYAMRGAPEEVAAEVRKYVELGVEDLALSFNELPTHELVAGAERFASEVAPLV